MGLWHIDWYRGIVNYYSEMLALKGQFMKKFDLKVVVSV